MKQFKTLRARFALWSSVLFLVVLVVFGVYVYASMASDLAKAVDNSLIVNASQVAAILDIQNGEIILSDSLIESPENADLRGQGIAIRILTPQGELLQTFGSFKDLPASTKLSFETYTDPVSETTVRIYNQPVYDNDILVAIVQVAQSLEETQITLRRLLITLAVSSPILVAVAGVSGYFLAARALSPIDQITLTARRISGEDLSARLNVVITDDEVGRLTKTLNEMLARLDDSFQRERQFTNDASHELRTPLTAMQAILGMIREKRRTPEEYEQALDDLSEETNRLQTLVENLLHLARGDRGTKNPYEKIVLSSLLEDIAESLIPLAEAKNLSLVCKTSGELVMMGDSDEIIRLFVNLLDNAIKYSERGGITISAKYGGMGIIVEISDTGIGILPEHLPNIFDRFYRVEKARTQQGAGLGLAIVKDIVHAHGGEIKVESKIGQGTTFILNFPSIF